MIKTPKVVLITQDFYPMCGGIATYLEQIYLKYFQKTDFNVIVPDYIGKKKCYDACSFAVYQTKFSPFTLDVRRERCNKQMLNILDALRPDILLFGYLRSHPEVGLFYKSKNPAVKVGIFMHAKEAFINDCICKKNNILGTHKGYLIKEAEFYKFILNKADFIFAVSTFTRNLLIKQGITREIHIIHPSVQINQTPLNSLSGNDKDITLLSVGRLVKRKGQGKVIEIMPHLLEKYPHLKYVIVGNGPERPFLKAQIERLCLGNCVTLASGISNKKLTHYYSLCDIFVLHCDFLPPNDVEGFGMVFLEANLYGKPVIGGNTGGTSDAIIHGKSGLLINPRSTVDLKRTISYLIENKNIRKELGSYGRDRVIKNFNNISSDYLVNLFNQA